MFHGTTILAVRHNGKVVMAGDGQVTLGATAIKHGARKVRRMYEDKILAGFAGSTADAFTLYERMEAKLKEFNGNLLKAAVELAKDWRTDKYLRRLEALLLLADDERTLMISGTGDVVEPDHDVIGIGSGGMYALAAARGIMESDPENKMEARTVAEKAMEIAADICVYTNTSVTVEVL